MQVNKTLYLVFMIGFLTSGLYAQNNKYTAKEVYTLMCSKCHGINAEGNIEKSAPPLNNIDLNELEISLFDLKSGASYQSSGTNHDVMQHNMKVIIQKGMNYDSKEMANYIFFNFNKDAKNYKKDRKYTVSEIYEQMCSKCHGKNAQGIASKDAPALNNKLLHDLELELVDIQNKTLTQSSGTNHDIMERNHSIIEKKGMKYTPKEMAEYINTNFYNK
ncbi:c-type cytochrome [Malaciobacter marinus]|uniref:Cytochrome c n=1 Tax=Malaciobacter marinus TaxID=505249 RepID=A0AB36ZTH8_9BACT|nr:c-type cytochrome [Malaciobacter marinus]PPK60411.1 cytochrome c [Malaciobacter marinus]SKB56608.1 Cytochrome c [Malaciobacter marinus]